MILNRDGIGIEQSQEGNEAPGGITSQNCQTSGHVIYVSGISLALVQIVVFLYVLV